MSKNEPLRGMSEREQEIMRRLLRMPHWEQKDAPKPLSKRGEAQRQRRQIERERRGADMK